MLIGAAIFAVDRFLQVFLQGGMPKLKLGYAFFPSKAVDLSGLSNIAGIFRRSPCLSENPSRGAETVVPPLNLCLSR